VWERRCWLREVFSVLAIVVVRQRYVLPSLHRLPINRQRNTRVAGDDLDFPEFSRTIGTSAHAGSFGAQLGEQDSLACSMAWERTVAVYKFALAGHSSRDRNGRRGWRRQRERGKERARKGRRACTTPSGMSNACSLACATSFPRSLIPQQCSTQRTVPN